MMASERAGAPYNSGQLKGSTEEFVYPVVRGYKSGTSHKRMRSSSSVGAIVPGPRNLWDGSRPFYEEVSSGSIC